MARRESDLELVPGRPPRRLSSYIKGSDYAEVLVGKYVKGERVVASSRTVANDMSWLTPGEWKVDDQHAGPYGHEINELAEIPPRMIEPQEFSWSDPLAELRRGGRDRDAAQYAEWMQAGLVPPPISVVQTDAGNLRAVDGHRRMFAADVLGVPVRAWVSWQVPHPDGLRDSRGRVIPVPLTYELATGNAWRP